jgi:hypothetical protein
MGWTRSQEPQRWHASRETAVTRLIPQSAVISTASHGHAAGPRRGESASQGWLQHSTRKQTTAIPVSPQMGPGPPADSSFWTAGSKLPAVSASAARGLCLPFLGKTSCLLSWTFVPQCLRPLQREPPDSLPCFPVRSCKNRGMDGLSLPLLPHRRLPHFPTVETSCKRFSHRPRTRRCCQTNQDPPHHCLREAPSPIRRVEGLPPLVHIRGKLTVCCTDGRSSISLLRLREARGQPPFGS